jgi:terminase small subunit-like protein
VTDRNSIASPRPYAQTGAYARSQSALEIRSRKVARLMRRLRVVAPWIEPSDEPTARAYCELEIMGAQIFAALGKMGDSVVHTTADGKDLDVRRLVDAHRQMKLAQLAYGRELGLTPASRMAIKATRTHTPFDLPAEMIANVNEVGESRRRERDAKEQDRAEYTENPSKASHSR